LIKKEAITRSINWAASTGNSFKAFRSDHLWMEFDEFNKSGFHKW